MRSADRLNQAASSATSKALSWSGSKHVKRRLRPSGHQMPKYDGGTGMDGNRSSTPTEAGRALAPARAKPGSRGGLGRHGESRQNAVRRRNSGREKFSNTQEAEHWC